MSLQKVWVMAVPFFRQENPPSHYVGSHNGLGSAAELFRVPQMEKENAVGCVSPPYTPHIFYGVKIWALRWPGKLLEVRLMFSEPIWNSSGTMYSCMSDHELSVTIKGTISTPAEQAPNHDTPTRPLLSATKARWIHGFRGFSPNSMSSISAKKKGVVWFIRSHFPFPNLRCPVSSFSTPLQTKFYISGRN
ncbi:hypothetical protein TNCV_1296821 [Trichonephila clavipes]|uniref:Uncharacterized protein n=1 Tax=Trichonephila clavipes TaxID=2585209 RepID=A0A8X6SIJ8_TRICX|nr:hypothetical protein TNCV_1296821 [Trichonephila clavipes]